MPPLDPVQLTQSLVRCPSVTPLEAGTLALLESVLTPLGFTCERHTFAAPNTTPVENLFATFGSGHPHLVFAGHVDVVPVGDEAAWTHPPFAAEIVDGVMYGRGTADMKSGVAAFIAATARRLSAGPLSGKISLLITCDEEGPSVNGTNPLIKMLVERGESFDCCIVGEPSSYEVFGDMIKIGRRGSLTGRLTVHGKQGHSAYPHRADNPIPRLLDTLTALNADKLDEGTANFQPSHLAITTVDVGNPAANVIPAKAQATFNARFNDTYSGQSLAERLSQICRRCAGRHDLRFDFGAEPFITTAGPLTEAATTAISKIAGRTPELSTTGGTSDARFIAPYCPVIEVGLVGLTIHQVDERVPVKEIEQLTDVYHTMLGEFFGQP